MSYKILYTKKAANGRKIKVINFSKGIIIEFLESDFKDLDEDLQQYIRSEAERIKNGQYDYEM